MHIQKHNLYTNIYFYKFTADNNTTNTNQNTNYVQQISIYIYFDMVCFHFGCFGDETRHEFY